MVRFTVMAVMLMAGMAHGGIQDGQIIYMNYNEGTGVVTNDSSGNGHHGVLFALNANNNGKWTVPVGQNIWTDGKWGSAVKMYGDQYKIMDTHVLKLEEHVGGSVNTQDFAYSFWVRRPTTRHIGWGASWVNSWDLNGNNVSPTDQEFDVDWWQWGDLQYDLVHTRYDEWASAPSSGRNLRTGFSAGGAWETDNIGYGLGSEWGDGEWHNIIMNIDGNPAGGETQRFELSVYFDGQLVQKVSQSGWGWGSSRTEAFTVGVSEELKGIDTNDDMDDVAAWNRLLTADEIAYLQTHPAPEPTSLVLLALGCLAVVRRKR